MDQGSPRRAKSVKLSVAFFDTPAKIKMGFELQFSLYASLAALSVLRSKLLPQSYG
jgi:hypothetical protein